MSTENDTNRTATVELQQHYGNTTVYPLNRTAGLLAELAGTKTLTRQTILLAEALGFSFQVRHLVRPCREILAAGEGELGAEQTTRIPAAELADHITTR